MLRFGILTVIVMIRLVNLPNANQIHHTVALIEFMYRRNKEHILLRSHMQNTVDAHDDILVAI